MLGTTGQGKQRRASLAGLSNSASEGPQALGVLVGMVVILLPLILLVGCLNSPDKATSPAPSPKSTPTPEQSSSPSQTPASDPASCDATIDSAVQRQLSYGASRQMTVNQASTVIAELGDLRGAPSGAVGPSPTITSISTPCQVSAQLTGPSPAFAIGPTGFQTQGFKDTSLITWLWNVTPHEAANSQLTLEVKPVFSSSSGTIDGGVRRFPIQVTVVAAPASLWSHVQGFFSNSVVLGVIAVVGAATGLAALWTGRKRRRRPPRTPRGKDTRQVASARRVP